MGGKPRSSSRTKNSILNLTSGFAARLFLLLMRFVTRTIFINTLGKSYLGINGLFSNILTLLSIAELGISTAITLRLYKPLAERDDERTRLLLKFYRQAHRVIGCAVVVLGLLLIPMLPVLIRDYGRLEHLGINATLIFVLFLTQSAVGHLFFAYRSVVISADQKAYIADTVSIAVAVLNNIVQIAVLIFLRNFILYTAVAIAFSVVQSLIIAILAGRMYPQFFIREKKSLSKFEIGEMFKDCGLLFVYKMDGIVLKATDNFVLSAFMGLATVGMYSNYLIFYGAINSILGKFYDSCGASIGNLYVTEDVSKSYFFFRVMNFISVVLYGTACVGMAVVANELILNWIGTEYLIAQPLPILIGIEILFVGIKNNLGQFRNISGAFRHMWFRPVLGIIINIFVSIALVRVWGICGVLLGTIAANVLTNFLIDPSIICKYSFRGYEPVSKYYRANFLYFSVLFAVGVADFLICRHALVGLGIISVLFHIVVCGMSVPAVFLLIFWRTDECRYVMTKGSSILKSSLRLLRAKLS